jgi:methionine--tRNA ligase beta chain
VGDVEVKEYLIDTLLKTFTKARVYYRDLQANPKKVKQILEKGTAKAYSEAAKTMIEVREAVGLTNKYSFFSYPAQSASGRITIDEFSKVEIRVGLVTGAINVEKSDKLIKLTVDFGELGMRTIFTGVRPFGYTPADIANKQFLFIFNLQPRRMMNEESQGMILAVDGPGGKPIFVTAEGMTKGNKVR